jgi:outer membrane protein OmpA-like peptidoglycan-associated protein
MPATGRLFALVLVAVACGGGGPAASQERSPAYSAEELVGILKPVRRGATRSLSPGTGPVTAPAPGTAGSGLLPDLKVLFPFNSAELTPDTIRQLDELGRALKSSELATLRFEVAGHTDSAGPDSYNEGLSARRAEAVAGYLERNYGVDAQRLEPRGYGKRRLLDTANPVSPRNRRVEIVTLQ